MRKIIILIIITLITLLLVSCAFQIPTKTAQTPPTSIGPTSASENTSSPTSTSNQRDDFGCWPPSCSFMPAGMIRQMCEDWKAGKTVNWFDCSYMSDFPKCQKLCEFEMKSNNKPSTLPSIPTLPTGQNYSPPPAGYSGDTGQNNQMPSSTTKEQCAIFASVTDCSYVGSPDSENYKICIKCASSSASDKVVRSGIPTEDSEAENVRIYFTDFKHGRIIRIDDMTGKNWVSYGSLGTGIGQFTTPEKFSVQPDGHIYIADPNGNRIVRIDDLTGKGWVSYGSHGIDGGNSRGVGQFNQPHAVRLDAQGRIYIADGGNCRIVRIDDMTGKGWTEYGTGKQCGQSATTIGNTFDIAFDAQGRIYTIDGTDTPRIIRIDDMTGKGFVTYGTKGIGVDQFSEPQSITFDAQGRIYVADENKDTQGGRIVRIDDMAGKGWTTFPLTYSDPKIKLPHDIMISASGKIYIANTRNNGIVRMDDMTGKGYIEYAPYPDGQRNVYPNQLEAPKGIFVVERK